jgi:hypothetical protein
MANEKNLEKAYKAIGMLRARGDELISVDRISKLSGVARQSFYQNDPDWVEVREVIKGKPSSRVSLFEVSATLETKAQLRIAQLASNVDRMEAKMRSVEQLSDFAYKRMADQILYYATKSMETPKKLEDRGRNIRELNAALEQNRMLRASLAEAQAAAQKPLPVSALIFKKNISLPHEAALDDIYDQFLDELNQLVPSRTAGESIGSVYLLCGLPLSGRSKWMEQHNVLEPGVALYIKTTGHTAKIRSRFIARLREKTEAPIHCVRLRADMATCIQRSAMQSPGVKHILNEKRILRLDAEFEEVTLLENFYSIILA